jgi:hypothetical protein
MIYTIRAVLAIAALSAIAYGCSISHKSTSRDSLPSGVLTSPCSILTQDEIALALPIRSDQYDARPGGDSPDSCHYALTILSKGMNAVDEEMIGAWIVDTKTKDARRIAAVSDIDYIFTEWISNDDLRLESDSHDTAAVYDLTHMKIASRELINVMFRFHFTGSDKRVVIKPANLVDPKCAKDFTTSGGFVSYSLSCIQQSNIRMIVCGYKTFTIKFLGRMSLEINGMVFPISDHGTLIDL